MNKFPCLSMIESGQPPRLVCMGHLIIRFEQYASYPTKLYTLCQKHNPEGWTTSIAEFLKADPSELDLGFSAPLQKEAWQTGSETGAMDFVMSHKIQSELEIVFTAGQATSLDVERKHAQDKKNEHSKVITVGRASRNTILRQYRTERHRIQADGVPCKMMLGKLE